MSKTISICLDILSLLKCQLIEVYKNMLAVNSRNKVKFLNEIELRDKGQC